MATKKKAGATDSPELARYKRKQKDSVNAWLAKFALLLTADGVKRVRVEYSGYGDSGQIDSFTYYADGGEEVENPFGSETMAKGFEELMYAILDKRGFNVNNEGSQGNLEWDLRKDTLSHHHEDNITTVEVTEYDNVLDLLGVVDPDNPE